MTAALITPGSTTTRAFGISNVEDAVQAREADHDAAFDGKCATAQSGAGAACNEGNVLLRAEPHDGLHLRGCRGQHHRERHNPKIGEAVALIRAQFVASGNQALADK